MESFPQKDLSRKLEIFDFLEIPHEAYFEVYIEGRTSDIHQKIGNNIAGVSDFQWGRIMSFVEDKEYQKAIDLFLEVLERIRLRTRKNVALKSRADYQERLTERKNRRWIKMIEEFKRRLG